MILIWWLIIILMCFVPAAVYHIVTKKYGGEPLLLKAKK